MQKQPFEMSFQLSYLAVTFQYLHSLLRHNYWQMLHIISFRIDLVRTKTSSHWYKGKTLLMSAQVLLTYIYFTHSKKQTLLEQCDNNIPKSCHSIGFVKMICTINFLFFLIFLSQPSSGFETFLSKPDATNHSDTGIKY